MGKKIVFIQGGPRKNGNTRAVTGVAIEAARNEDALINDPSAMEKAKAFGQGLAAGA
jgi:multimeric flavodoxin WrbA